MSSPALFQHEHEAAAPQIELAPANPPSQVVMIGADRIVVESPSLVVPPSSHVTAEAAVDCEKSHNINHSKRHSERLVLHVLFGRQNACASQKVVESLCYHLFFASWSRHTLNIVLLSCMSSSFAAFANFAPAYCMYLSLVVLCQFIPQLMVMSVSHIWRLMRQFETLWLLAQVVGWFIAQVWLTSHIADTAVLIPTIVHITCCCFPFTMWILTDARILCPASVNAVAMIQATVFCLVLIAFYYADRINPNIPRMTTIGGSNGYTMDVQDFAAARIVTILVFVIKNFLFTVHHPSDYVLIRQGVKKKRPEWFEEFESKHHYVEPFCSLQWGNQNNSAKQQHQHQQHQHQQQHQQKRVSQMDEKEIAIEEAVNVAAAMDDAVVAVQRNEL